MDAAKLQFKDESFDFVFSYDTFEHFAKPELVLQEAMEKLSLKTKDLAAENITKLSAIFPEIITEVETDGKIIKTINADKLKELIGDYANNFSEVYELNWVGKQKSRQKIVMPINKTLCPGARGQALHLVRCKA